MRKCRSRSSRFAATGTSVMGTPDRRLAIWISWSGISACGRPRASPTRGGLIGFYGRFDRDRCAPRGGGAMVQSPSPGRILPRSHQRVLGGLALRQQRQGLPCDMALEVRALLVRLEGGLVAEQLVEQELRRIVLGAA